MRLLPALLLSAAPLLAQEGESVRAIIQLSGHDPVVVAQHEAQKALLPFDRAGHEQLVLASQLDLLDRAVAAGIALEVTSTPLHLAGGVLHRPNHFQYLINAVGVELAVEDLARLKAMDGVLRVDPEELFSPQEDNSVRYVRANDGPGEKTIFTQGGGTPVRYDGTGQVVAILDTGIEHTHPSFDVRFSDAEFESRTGDTRPVRVAGAAYEEGTHHPKVVYFLALTASTNEDDVGHGTHAAADAAGMKVLAPGLDKLPGTADDQIVEGVAPGALLMNYKVCETLFTCVGTANIITVLEDALSPVDPAGNPKPVATVINMSFGGGSGDPNAPSSVASSNAALAGAVVVSSAGNSGPGEQTTGAPSAGRRVMSVAASKDPGALTNEVDVMVPDPLRYGLAGSSTGAQDDSGLPPAPQDGQLPAIIMGGSPDVPFPLGQHYVYCGLADTPDQIPAEVAGRVALVLRGSTLDLGASGTGAFANKVAQVSAAGAVAVLIMNSEPGELENATAAGTTIPAFGMSDVSGAYLRDTLGFESPLFDKDLAATWGTISKFPVRINLPDPTTFVPNTTGFSSRGSIVAARYVKPDVTAPGENIYGATIPAGGVSTGGGTMSDPSRYISVSGTSFSGPHVAGAAALVREAFLTARGELPPAAEDLRSGAAAAQQAFQMEVAPQSIVRGALTGSATNLRDADGETTLSDLDERTFQHEIGAGLIHVIEAVDARAVIGTNDLNGLLGADDANDPDFLPTHSFGQREVIQTGVEVQSDAVTVTLQNVAGPAGAGDYSLTLVDMGRDLGDVTAPIVGTTGFSVSLSTTDLTIGPGLDDQATFDVSVVVDGRPAPDGLAAVGLDVGGRASTEFLWAVVATGTNGEQLRMPFTYRAVLPGPPPPRAAPFLTALRHVEGADERGPVDTNGLYTARWTFPSDVEQAEGYLVEEATQLVVDFEDDAEEALVQGENSTWTSADWNSTVHPDTGTTGYSPTYIDEQDSSLTLVTPVTLGEGVSTLAFTSNEDIELDFDYGLVEASTDGVVYVTLATYTGVFSGTRSIDLAGYAGGDLYLRFRLKSDELVSTPAHLGWFIDDIRIESADFVTLGTSGPNKTKLDIVKDLRGESLDLGNGLRAGRFVESDRYYYRVRGLFEGGSAIGPASNVRTVVLDAQHASEDAIDNPDH